LFTFLLFATVVGLTFLVARATAGFCLALTVFVFEAFRARALPAAGRLVAGFKRVDFFLEVDLRDRRADDGEETFFTVLANGVLMRKLPR
jgi:hypothetical protein